MVPYGKIFSYFIKYSRSIRNILVLFRNILQKTLELLICNHLIIHIWSFYKNILDIIFQKIC